jgi:hypothetical protein
MKINSGNSYLRAASYLRTAAISSGISYVVILIISFVLLAVADIEIQSLSIQTIVIHLIPPQIAFGFASAFFLEIFNQELQKSHLEKQWVLWKQQCHQE